MEEAIQRAALALALVFYGLVSIAGAAPAVCSRPSAGESIIGPSEICSTLDSPATSASFQGVVEGDEMALQRAASIVHIEREQYIAVLFYASWCPFSKIGRPNFNIMPSLFPSIPHFAFEESSIRPSHSILSRYGVHGYPTFFLLNSTMRVRYHGSRSIGSLTTFYSDITGVKPAPPESTVIDKTVSLLNLTEDIGGTKQENCPFSWARSPENLLQQHTYLALASSFLLLRLLYILFPKLSACALSAWRWRMRLPSLINPRNCSQAFLHQAKLGFSRLNPGKRTNLQEGAMNAKAWASKSLASVSIGEPSSIRAQSLG